MACKNMLSIYPNILFCGIGPLWVTMKNGSVKRKLQVMYDSVLIKVKEILLGYKAVTWW